MSRFRDSRNRGQLEAVELELWLPTIQTRDIEDGAVVSEDENVLSSCEGFHVPQDGYARGFLTVLSMSIDDDQALGTTSIFGRFGDVYASAESLYVAVATSSAGGWNANRETVVHKFSLAAAGAPSTYDGSGWVPGQIVNQFAMDEHEGTFRIATTEGWSTANNLFVMAPTPEGLSVVGSVRGIASGENIRSVRFDGERAFMVTFRQTDPLYTFDLSTPETPRILGELKIPGFSTYMHFLDDGHLLTIGYDATEWGEVRGVMLQIFDVTDMQDPALTHKEVIGTWGSSSEATANHLAFTFFESRGLLAIPMAICDSSYRMSFNGLMVYEVDTQTGFELVGRVPHGSQQWDCWTWWEDPASAVQRSIFMDDFVYSLSSDALKVNYIDALEEDLVSVPLPRLNTDDALYCR